jgi:non-specific serine/threonine protein kinase
MQPDSPQPTALSPPLAILRDTPAGALYGLTDKSTLFHGLEDCMHGSITGAEWLDGGAVLTLKLQSGRKVTFAASGTRLLTNCSCPDWQAGRECRHVVACWALLKKTVSPDSLSSIFFSPRLLRDVEILTGMDEVTVPPKQKAPKREVPAASLRRARASKKTADAAQAAVMEPAKASVRLVLEEKEGFLFGAIHRGEEQVYTCSYGWDGVPADLRRFMTTRFRFEATRDYFEEFSALKGGYPIVLRRMDDRETPLEFRADEPLRAGVVFRLEKDEVRITRCLHDGSPLPRDAVVAGECLIDPAEKAIHPVAEGAPWKVWRSILESLDELSDMIGDDVEQDNETITTSVDSFNFAALRISPELMKKMGKSIRFHFNDEEADLSVSHPFSWFLEAEDDLNGESIGLVPRGELAGVSCPFPENTFLLFTPSRRSSLPHPLRAKKRLTAMIDTAFAVLDSPNATAGDKALRVGLGGPNFLKRAVKSEAKRVVNAFTRCCGERMLFLLATPDGWRFGVEDRIIQTRMVRLLYGFFGLDSFTDGEWPCSLEIDRETFLARLGELMAALEREGFGFRLRGETLSVGRWDFAVNAVSDGIDWFELSPEIRCNGELLAVEEIRGLLDSGILRQGNTCYLLGDEQRQILELLTDHGGAKGKRKKKSDIVRIPRLQILDWLELRSHGVTLRLPPEEEKLLAGLTRLEKIPEPLLPPGLTADLRAYQKEGFHWLAFLHEHRFGACLADDMGLGKTVQTIAFLAGLAEGTIPCPDTERLPHLVVVPPSLLFNWESEIARFYPAFRMITYAGQKRNADFTGADIVLTSYGILQRDADILAAIPFHVAVFDEAQQVKNISAATTGAARRISARFKLALTGTPMENHLGEYFSIMDLCVPGLLGRYEEFRRRVDIRGFGGVDTLVRRTRPFILRRSKQMIADELPPRVEADLYLEMNAKQKALYQKTVEEVKGKVSEAYRDKAPGQARMIALTAILRLRQICLCPSLVASGSRPESPKLECLAEQLHELRDEGHAALVFSQFTSYLDIIEQGLKHHKIPYLRLDGSTPVAKRKELVNSFQKSEEPLVFLISLKAGGKGLNLTRATYVYHLDPWWNPAVENQASDRAHRIGQTAKVTVTRLLMRHTVEEKMMALKNRKLKLYKALLDDASGAGGAALTKEDFDFLLTP